MPSALAISVALALLLQDLRKPGIGLRSHRQLLAAKDGSDSSVTGICGARKLSGIRFLCERQNGIDTLRGCALQALSGFCRRCRVRSSPSFRTFRAPVGLQLRSRAINIILPVLSLVGVAFAAASAEPANDGRRRSVA